MATLLLHDGIVELRRGLDMKMEFVLGCLEEHGKGGNSLEIDLRGVTQVSSEAVLMLQTFMLSGAREAFQIYGESLCGEWTEAVMRALAAASFLQAAEAETAMCIMLGRVLREKCQTGAECRDMLGMEDGEMDEEEVRRVDALLTRTGRLSKQMPDLWSDGRQTRGMTGKFGVSGSGEPPKRFWVDAVSSFEEMLLGDNEGRHRDTVHGAVCMSAIARFGSVLAMLNEDLLCKVATHACAVVVPDECGICDAFKRVGDFALTRQKILVRHGMHIAETGIEVTDKAVVVLGIEEGCIVRSSGNVLITVGGEHMDGALFADGLRFELEGLNDGKGYWEKGPVVLKTGANGWAGLHRCHLTCLGGGAALVQGMEPGCHEYLTEGDDNRLLPYATRQIVNPLSVPKSRLLLSKCLIGPCTGPSGCGVAASTGGAAHLWRCDVADIGLDGLVASAGGRLVADQCCISDVRESGVVASGVSTHKMYAAEEFIVERSHATAVSCDVESGEEPLWACESGLLTHYGCSLKSTSDAPVTKEVTGGIVTETPLS